MNRALGFVFCFIASFILPACSDGPAHPQGTTNAHVPQVIALEMAPSAKPGMDGDYTIVGRIRYFDEDADVLTRRISVTYPLKFDARSTTVHTADGYEPITLRLPPDTLYQRGYAEYEVTVIDAQGHESAPIHETVRLEPPKP